MEHTSQHVLRRPCSLSVLVPVYNGELSIRALVDEILTFLGPRFQQLEIILVNDGSPDNSHDVIVEIVKAHPGLVKYVQLARNFGEHNAVMCGLRYVTKDYVAIIDDDFQNPPEEIVKLVDASLQGGHDVVYSYYENKQHNLFRNLGSAFHNSVANLLLNKPNDLYLSSFKVMNALLVRTVTKYTGPYPYLDGLILDSTNSIGKCLCEHRARNEGRSNYNLRRLVRLWLVMVTSHSVMPLRISTFVGFGVAGLSFLLFIFFITNWFLGAGLLNDQIPAGWASIISMVTMLGGIQLCMLGILGEYIGRTFLTLNQIPQFVVREEMGVTNSNESDSNIRSFEDACPR